MNERTTSSRNTRYYMYMYNNDDNNGFWARVWTMVLTATGTGYDGRGVAKWIFRLYKLCECEQGRASVMSDDNEMWYCSRKRKFNIIIMGAWWPHRHQNNVTVNDVPCYKYAHQPASISSSSSDSSNTGDTSAQRSGIYIQYRRRKKNS